MAKKKKQNKISVPLLKYIFLGAFLIFAVFLVGNKTITAFKDSPQFIIKKVQIDPAINFISSSYHLTRLTGKNIFTVDLEALKKRLVLQYPQLSEIRINRQFPDTIRIIAKKRAIFAQAKINNLPVTFARDGFILSTTTALNKHVILIEGLKVNPAQVWVGRPLRLVGLD